MTVTKTVLFGGSFDPIHIGHTTVAESAMNFIEAQKLIFIPVSRSPLKHTDPYATAQQRLDMISLAIKNKPQFEVSDFELKRPAPNYTIDTVKHFIQSFDKTDNTVQIHLLIGADCVNELDRWHRITELIRLCELRVMYRAGFAKPDFSRLIQLLGHKQVEKLTQNVVPVPLVDISSTEIRKAIAAEKDVTDLLDKPVTEYIKQHRLYKKTNVI